MGFALQSRVHNLDLLTSSRMSMNVTAFMICLLLGLLIRVHADLRLGFYDQSCPKAEKLVLDHVKEHIPHAPSLAASLLRMHFHDCFVRV